MNYICLLVVRKLTTVPPKTDRKGTFQLMALDFEGLCRFAAESGASDIYIKEGAPPALKIDSSLRKLEHPPLTHDDLEKVVKDLLTEEQFRGIPEESRPRHFLQHSRCRAFSRQHLQSQGRLRLVFARRSTAHPQVFGTGPAGSFGRIHARAFRFSFGHGRDGKR